VYLSALRSAVPREGYVKSLPHNPEVFMKHIDELLEMSHGQRLSYLLDLVDEVSTVASLCYERQPKRTNDGSPSPSQRTKGVGGK